MVFQFNVETLEYAKNNNIVLVILPAHTTALIQAQDVFVFDKLKLQFNKVAQQIFREGEYKNQVLGKQNFLAILNQIWDSVNNPVLCISHHPATYCIILL